MSIDLMPVDCHPERKPIYQSCHIHTLLSQLQAVFSLHSDYAHHICIGMHTKKDFYYPDTSAEVRKTNYHNHHIHNKCHAAHYLSSAASEPHVQVYR